MTQHPDTTVNPNAAQIDALNELAKISRLIARGALFVINHSAGKDSQAMTIYLRTLVPEQQLIVIHADLGRMDWEDSIDHIKKTIGELSLLICRNENKTFMEMVRHRGKFPSPAQRQCTSDQKRGPIERTIRRYLKSHPEFNGLIVNCMGMRADESPARSRQTSFRLNDRNSKAGREWYDWLPIFNMDTQAVFSLIKANNQKPHWGYAAGMSRHSCPFCFMSNRSDLCTAVGLFPNLYRELVSLEKEIDHTLSMSGRGLEEITGISVDDLEQAS